MLTPHNSPEDSQQRVPNEQPHISGAKNMVSSPTSGERYVTAENKPRLSSFTTNKTTGEQTLKEEDTDIDGFSTANRTLRSFSLAEVPTKNFVDNSGDDDDDDDLQIISIREEDDGDEDYVDGPQRRKKTIKKKTTPRAKSLKAVQKPRAPLKLENVSLPRFSSNFDLETVNNINIQAGRLTRASSSLLQKFDVGRNSSGKSNTKELEEIIISDSESECESSAQIKNLLKPTKNDFRLTTDTPSSPFEPEEPMQNSPIDDSNFHTASTNNKDDLPTKSPTGQFIYAKSQQANEANLVSNNGEKNINYSTDKKEPASGNVTKDTKRKQDVVNDFGLNLEDVDISESDGSDDESFSVEHKLSHHDSKPSKITTDDQYFKNKNEQHKNSFCEQSRTVSLSPTPQQSIASKTESQERAIQNENSVNTSRSSTSKHNSFTEKSHFEHLNDTLETKNNKKSAFTDNDDDDDDMAILDDDDDDDDFFFGDYIKNDQQRQKNLDSSQKKNSSITKPLKKEKFQAKGRALHLSNIEKISNSTSKGAEEQQSPMKTKSGNDMLSKLLLEDDLLLEIESERNSKLKRGRTTENSSAKKFENDSPNTFHAEHDLLLQTAKKFKRASQLTDVAALRKKTAKKRMYMLLIVSKIPELKDKSIEVKVYGDQNFDHIIPNVLHSLFNFYEMPELENIYFKDDLVLYYERVRLQYFMTLDSLGIPETSNNDDDDDDDLTEVKIDLVLKATAESKNFKMLESIMEEKNKAQLTAPNKQLNATEAAQLELMNVWEAELNLKNKEEPFKVAEPQRSTSPTSFVIYLVGSDNKKLKANVTNATKMKSLAAYYRKEKVVSESNKISFTFDNEDIPQESTVGELDMEEEDMLEVIIS